MVGFIVVMALVLTSLAQAQAGFEERYFEANIMKHGERF